MNKYISDTTAIICAKNEQSTVGQIVRRTKKYVADILLIDGNSTDDTMHIAKMYGAQVIPQQTGGKGAAIRLGIQKAQSPILIFLDADGSHNPDDIPKLLDPIRKNFADFVIASRSTGGSDEYDGRLETTVRAIGSAIIAYAINLKFKTSLTDIQNGFRAIRTIDAKRLSLQEDSFTIEQEMVIRALKNNVRISEIPSHEYKRVSGISRIILKRVWWPYLMCLMRNLL